MRPLPYLAVFTAGLLVGVGLQKFFLGEKDASTDDAASAYVATEGDSPESYIVRDGKVAPGMDPDAALQALQSIPDRSARMSALASLIGNLYARNPERAVELVKGLPPGMEKTRAVEMVATKWMDTDLEGALAFCETLSPEMLRA